MKQFYEKKTTIDIENCFLNLYLHVICIYRDLNKWRQWKNEEMKRVRRRTYTRSYFWMFAHMCEIHKNSQRTLTNISRMMPKKIKKQKEILLHSLQTIIHFSNFIVQLFYHFIVFYVYRMKKWKQVSTSSHGMILFQALIFNKLENRNWIAMISQWSRLTHQYNNTQSQYIIATSSDGRTYFACFPCCLLGFRVLIACSNHRRIFVSFQQALVSRFQLTQNEFYGSVFHQIVNESQSIETILKID